MMKYLMLVNQNVQDLHRPRGRRQAGPPNGQTMTEFYRVQNKYFPYPEPQLFDKKDGTHIVVFWYGVMLFGCRPDEGKLLHKELKLLFIEPGPRNETEKYHCCKCGYLMDNIISFMFHV